ncbi:GNOM-like 2 [Wolffia australiana]
MGHGQEARVIRGCTAYTNLRNHGVSCMLNTEVAAVLAVIRRSSDGTYFASGDGDPSPSGDAHLLQSLRSLRSFIFNPGNSDWLSVEPTIYLGPFLDVIQSGDVPAAATGVALSAVHKILKLGVFDETTPGAGDAVHSVVLGAAGCRLERTDAAAEDAVLMRVLQLLSALLRHPAAVLLSDHAVSTVVNTCFQVVQLSAGRGHLLRRTARYAMHELVQTIFSRLPEIPPATVDDVYDGDGAGGYGAKCLVDVFQFLCSLLNVAEVVESPDGLGPACFDEDIQLFALILINSAIELGGEFIGDHPKLLRIVQDDLFHHLVLYGARTRPLVLSMICSIVLNLYHFLRGWLRLHLEAFFVFVLLRTTSGNAGAHLQEVAVEGIIGLCRQPGFAIEMYVNYDCDPRRRDVLEETIKSLCRAAFPTSSSLSPLQTQALEGLIAVVDAMAEGIDPNESPQGESYEILISEYEPFWEERSDSAPDQESRVRLFRTRKLKKKKIAIAAAHFNRDEKKGLEFLKISGLLAGDNDARGVAFFLRHAPGLDKNKIGNFLGEPDEFNVLVLREFASTFDLAGVSLDAALRGFLVTFRLPGESQKIERILGAFSESFYEQQSSNLFAGKDAVHVLCFSLIMLNTDHHNPQVKKKMTEEEFIRNNRAMNGDKDFPREYLAELFQSISGNAITLSGGPTGPAEMTSSRWIEIVNRSKLEEPFIACDSDFRLCRDAFAAIAGPTVATLFAVFDHTDDEETLHDCVEGFFLVARISQHGLEDIIDELIDSFCKSTALLNPYSTPEETLFTFTNDVRSRMATLAAFTMANKFASSVRGGWRCLLDCLLRLKKLRVLPQHLGDTSAAGFSSAAVFSSSGGSTSVLSATAPGGGGGGGRRQAAGLMGRFSQFLSLDGGADSMADVCGELENNLKLIQQCQIGNIFADSGKLPEECLLCLGRALIFAAGGRGQKLSTPIEEEETVGLCWELLVAITKANMHRFLVFWPQFHDHFVAVAQLPLFSPCPFSEKAMNGLFAICLKLFSRASRADKPSEELIFKSINLIWKLDKEVIDSCCESIAESVSRLLIDHRSAIQSPVGWKTTLQLLAIAGRHQGTYDRSVQALNSLLTDEKCVNRGNYGYCVDAALGFAASKTSPSEDSIKIIDRMADSVRWLVRWSKNGHGDYVSNASSSSVDDGLRMGGGEASLFMKLAEAMRKIGLVRREEIRNHAVAALRRSFAVAAEELEFTPASSMWCFNHVVFAMVDDLHEKTLEYARREGAEREMRSMEGTLKEAMELLVDVYLLFLPSLRQNPSFPTFWLGFLRRMDTCMKGESEAVQALVPELLKKVIVEMQGRKILVKRDGDELWDRTVIQIQWIAPSVKDELFPDEF